MRRNPKLYLGDIVESIDAINRYINNFTEEDFFQDTQAQDAVIRRLEIIGEAVKNLDEEFRQLYSNIPWKSIAGMRDVLIHEYFGVDLHRIWLTIKRDLPAIEGMMKKILKTL